MRLALAAILLFSPAIYAQSGGLTNPFPPPGTVSPFLQLTGTVQVRGDGSVVLKTGTGIRDTRLLSFTTRDVQAKVMSYNGRRVRVTGYQEIGALFPFEVGNVTPAP